MYVCYWLTKTVCPVSTSLCGGGEQSPYPYRRNILKREPLCSYSKAYICKNGRGRCLFCPYRKLVAVGIGKVKPPPTREIKRLLRDAATSFDHVRFRALKVITIENGHNTPPCYVSVIKPSIDVFTFKAKICTVAVLGKIPPKGCFIKDAGRPKVVAGKFDVLELVVDEFHIYEYSIWSAAVLLRKTAPVRYTTHMKLYSWNVNGIRAVEKKGLLREFIMKHQPDVLCIQETKAQEAQVAEEFAALYPEYHQFWYSAEKKGYSGTALWSKEEPEAVLHGIPEHIAKQYTLADDYGDTTAEGRVLVAEFPQYYVATVYTPNAKDDLSRIPMREAWDPAFLTYMKQLREEKPVIFCGDFNVAHTEDDLARPKPNVGKKGFTQEERSGFDAMVAGGFVDTFRMFTSGNGHYTWWSHFGKARERNVGWRIDYVMVDEVLAPLVKRATIHADVLGSDHCPVAVDIREVE